MSAYTHHRCPARPLTIRGRAALAAGATARWASWVTGRGSRCHDRRTRRDVPGQVDLAPARNRRRTVVVTGTNGKSTTTRMIAAALNTIGPVATNAEGANMDAGLVAALAGSRDAVLAALEVDEMRPHVSDAVSPRPSCC